MAFGAIVGGALGLAGSVYGANSASNQAEADRAQSAFDAQQMRIQADNEMALTMRQWRDQQEENARQRIINNMNRGIAGQEQLWQKDQYEEYKRQLLKERAGDIRRQVQIDRAAAQQRQFEIRQLLQNQDLSAEEREYALAELKNAQAIAEGEREEELIRFYEDRASKEIERDFYIAQMEQAQGQFQAERKDDLRIRQQLLDRIDRLGGTVEAAYDELDYVPRMRQISEMDIDTERRRREADYIGDVDRAATLTASINEADLIRGGIDASTPGTARRGEVAARIANEYQDARSRAYSEAVDYISGKTAAMNQNIAGLMDQRQQRLAEAQGVAEAGMGYYSQLPGVASATGAFNLLSGTPTGIMNRDISSANNYRAPIGINSAIYDRQGVSSGLGEYYRPGSLADTQFFNVGSRIYSPFQAQTGFNMVGNPMAAYTSAANNSAQMYANSRAAAAQAGQMVGYGANKFFNDNISDSLTDWYDKKFGADSFFGSGI